MKKILIILALLMPMLSCDLTETVDYDFIELNQIEWKDYDIAVQIKVTVPGTVVMYHNDVSCGSFSGKCENRLFARSDFKVGDKFSVTVNNTYTESIKFVEQ